MNKNTRGRKMLPMDHKSQRLQGPERKRKHQGQLLDEWQDELEAKRYDKSSDLRDPEK